MTDPTTAHETPGQRRYRELLIGSLIYSVVLGLLNSYTTIVETRSYSFLLYASVVLELLTVGAFKIKDRIIGSFRHREGARYKAAMALGVWFVMFSSKFVFIWVINIVFGDDVNVNGFFGILLVVASVTMLHHLAAWIDVQLGTPPPEKDSGT